MLSLPPPSSHRHNKRSDTSAHLAARNKTQIDTINPRQAPMARARVAFALAVLLFVAMAVAPLAESADAPAASTADGPAANSGPAAAPSPEGIDGLSDNSDDSDDSH